jgi:hypothetical protein
MAHLDLMQVCELAYFDRHARLCLVGITTHLALPSLPIRIRQLMIVGRVADLTFGEPLDVSFAMMTPSGQWLSPADDDTHVELSSEYVVVTLHDIPFQEEGPYRFAIQLGSQQLASIVLP